MRHRCWKVGKHGDEGGGVLLPLKGLNVRHYTCFDRSAHPLPKPSSPPRCTFQSCPSSNAPLPSFPRESVIDHLKDAGGRSDRPAFWLVPNWDNYLPTCYLSSSIKIILHKEIYISPVIYFSHWFWEIEEEKMRIAKCYTLSPTIQFCFPEIHIFFVKKNVDH